MDGSLSYNIEKNGIEISFSERPSKEVLEKLKAHKFRWSRAKKIWWSKATDEAKEFAHDLINEISPPTPQNSTITFNYSPNFNSISTNQESNSNSELQSSNKTRPNTFAAYYEKTNGIPVFHSSDVSFFNCYKEGYYEDINVYFSNLNNHSCILIDLTNAQRKGKECERYSIFGNEIEIGEFLYNEMNLHTVKDLYEAVKSNKDFLDLKVTVGHQKGIDTFSPFAEIKPIKEPQKEYWTKTQFINALMSGQIYQGTMICRLSDDYAYDAANNFFEGTGLDLSHIVSYAIEHWSKLNYVHVDGKNEENHTILCFGNSFEYKEFLFDENCNQALAAERREMRMLEKKESFSKKDSCLDEKLVLSEIIRQAEKIRNNQSIMDTSIPHERLMSAAPKMFEK